MPANEALHFLLLVVVVVFLKWVLFFWFLSDFPPKRTRHFGVKRVSQHENTVECNYHFARQLLLRNVCEEEGLGVGGDTGWCITLKLCRTERNKNIYRGKQKFKLGLVFVKEKKTWPDLKCR